MYSKVYTFRSFLGLNSSQIISEPPNLTNTFVLMLLVTILSFADWSGGMHGCIVFVYIHNYAYNGPGVN